MVSARIYVRSYCEGQGTLKLDYECHIKKRVFNYAMTFALVNANATPIVPLQSE